MNFGIFGDSFSYEDVLNNNLLKHPLLPNAGSSWVNLLRQNYDITNYSTKGCDPYYMYKVFMDNHSQHDNIIFVFPRPGRISINGFHIPFVENTSGMGTDVEYVAYSMWHKHLYNEEKESHYVRLLKASIIETRPDVKFMYGANWEFGFEATPIINISRLEDKAWGETALEIRRKYMDLRYCHMTKENNITLYKLVLDQITSGTEIKIDYTQFRAPSLEEKECYLIPK